MIRNKLGLTCILLGLSACSRQYPLLPTPESTKQIEGSKIIYILPNDIEETSGSIHRINFETYEGGNSDRNNQRLILKNKGDIIEIHRRADNGVAGSGVIYTVAVDAVSKPEATTVTFTPKTQRRYQDGVLLPFPVPDFDVESYLAKGELSCTFEITSDYPPESVKANLQRLLGGGFDDRYTLDTNSEHFEMEARIHPYRHGQSKVVIHATLYNKSLGNKVLDIAKKIQVLKEKMKSIVNS